MSETEILALILGRPQGYRGSGTRSHPLIPFHAISKDIDLKLEPEVRGLACHTIALEILSLSLFVFVDNVFLVGRIVFPTISVFN